MRWAFANSCLLCRDLWHFIKASSQTLLDWDHGMWLCSWRWSRSHKLNPFSFSLELFCTFHRNRTSQHVKGYKQHAPSNINTLFVVLDRFKSFLWGNRQAEDGEAFAVGWVAYNGAHIFFLLPKRKNWWHLPLEDWVMRRNLTPQLQEEITGGICMILKQINSEIANRCHSVFLQTGEWRNLNTAVVQ